MLLYGAKIELYGEIQAHRGEIAPDLSARVEATAQARRARSSMYRENASPQTHSLRSSIV